MKFFLVLFVEKILVFIVNMCSNGEFPITFFFFNRSVYVIKSMSTVPLKNIHIRSYVNDLGYFIIDISPGHK